MPRGQRGEPALLGVLSRVPTTRKGRDSPRVAATTILRSNAAREYTDLCYGGNAFWTNTSARTANGTLAVPGATVGS
jgi:hypothetical protein